MYKWDDGSCLAHYGTKGMRWGTRNYQYEDGSLTPAGIERYRKGLKKAARLELKAEKYRKKDNSKLISRSAKLNARSAMYNAKAAKAMARGRQNAVGKYTMKAAKYARRAAKLQYKVARSKYMADKYQAKGQKIADDLANKFGRYSMSDIDRMSKELERDD